MLTKFIRQATSTFSENIKREATINTNLEFILQKKKTSNEDQSQKRKKYEIVFI